MQFGKQSPLRNPFRHADGAGGADEAAEVAADAFGAGNAGLACLRIEGDGLVPAVAAGEEAASATGAFFTVNSGEDHGVAVKVGGEGKGGQQLAHNLFKVLLNGREAHLPFETDTWPYYDWDTFKTRY